MHKIAETLDFTGIKKKLKGIYQMAKCGKNVVFWVKFIPKLSPHFEVVGEMGKVQSKNYANSYCL